MIGGVMDEKERMELERLLDLADMEQLMLHAPGAEQEAVQEDRMAALAGIEQDAAAARATRERLLPDAEWLEEE